MNRELVAQLIIGVPLLTGFACAVIGHATSDHSLKRTGGWVVVGAAMNAFFWFAVFLAVALRRTK